MSRLLPKGCWILAACAWCVSAAAQDAPPDRAEAEARLEALQREISTLQQQLGERREAHSGAQDELRRLDLDVQASALALRDVRQQRAQQEARLADLELQRSEALERLSQRNAQLAEQVRAAYRQGRESRLKLVLNQDQPERLSRTLAYYEYLNRAQKQRMDALRGALAELDQLQAEIDTELVALAAVEEEQARALQDLETQRQHRSGVVEKLAASIGADENRLVELERNRADLEALIERLGDALADIPLDLSGEKPVAESRGELPMPVDGSVAHAYGQPRGGGARWEGWLLRAERGTEVRAVARGRVAYADWLRGYGLLLIVEHGDGYMSLYGHNESLLHDVGEWVSGGEAIATVGQGADGQTGLYFEWRREGQVLDPAAWIQR